MLDAPVNVLIDIAMHPNGALMAAPLGSALKETVLLDTALLGSLVQPDSEIRPDVAAHLLAALLGKTLLATIPVGCRKTYSAGRYLVSGSGFE